MWKYYFVPLLHIIYKYTCGYIYITLFLQIRTSLYFIMNMGVHQRQVLEADIEKKKVNER